MGQTIHSVVKRTVVRYVAASLLTTTVVSAQSDTVQKTFFTRRDLVAVGAFVAVGGGLSVFDKRIARYFRDTSLAHVRDGQRLANYSTRLSQTTLTAGGLAIYAVGRLAGAKPVADIAFHTVEAVAAAGFTGQIIRGPVGRVRPIEQRVEGSDQYRFEFLKGFSDRANCAFPSIHSSSAFAAATVLVAETHERKPRATVWVAVPAYALALTPGLGRMYQGQHWASDVASGAVLGAFYGWRIVTYSHRHSTTFVDRIFLGKGEGLRVSPVAGGVEFGWSGKF